MQPTYICMFVSRNKDNQYLSNFKPRKFKFLTHLSYNDDSIVQRFEEFINAGVPGELVRMYMSVNTRDMTKTKLALQHYLLDHDVDFVNFDDKIISLAAKSENAATHRWLLDVDTKSDKVLHQILTYLDMHHSDVSIEVNTTLNGYAIVCDHGFDTRSLLTNFPEVELKRDDMLMRLHGHLESDIDLDAGQL